MDRPTLAHILDVLVAMAQSEIAVAKLYRLCAEPEGDARQFWLTLEHEELRHAQQVDRLAEIIAQRPDRFTPKRAMHVTAIQTFTCYVDSIAQRILINEIPHTDQRRLLTAARDVEQSIIESRYHELVTSDEPEFQTLMKAIVADTTDHKNRIVARLAKLSNPA
jgi:hypothetical protein